MQVISLKKLVEILKQLGKLMFINSQFSQCPSLNETPDNIFSGLIVKVSP